MAEVLCVNCHRPIEPDPESVSGWWKHKDGKYSCFHNTNAEPADLPSDPAIRAQAEARQIRAAM